MTTREQGVIEQDVDRREGDNNNNMGDRRSVLCDKSGIVVCKGNTKHGVWSSLDKDTSEYGNNALKEFTI